MKKNGLIHYLGKAELNKLKNQIENKRDQLLLEILYETGCTVNELINIKIKDINFENKTITFPSQNTKTNKKRISHISLQLASKIKSFAQKQKTEYLFSTRQSSQITTKRVRQIIQSHAKKAGLSKTNPQTIRYTHVAHALQKNLPLITIQKQVGLEKLRIVQIYESLVPEKENLYHKFFAE